MCLIGGFLYFPYGWQGNTTMPEKKGFTLIALMVVMAIMTVLAVLGIPNLISWLPKYRSGSAAREILSVVQQARFRAVKENANVVLSFDPAQDTYKVFVDNGSGTNAANLIQDPDEATVSSGSMPGKVDMYDASFSGKPYFYFNSKGLLPPEILGGHVKLRCSPDDFIQVTVINTGSARIKRSKD